jgi:hypothetical protein
MRRAQAILVILTLAALPLVMLARPSASTGCDGMCCVRHRAHSPASGAGSESPEMSCHHGALGDMFECGMKSNSHALDFSALAPIAPTRLSSLMTLLPPPISRSTVVQTTQNAAVGFLPDLFEPPRA